MTAPIPSAPGEGTVADHTVPGQAPTDELSGNPYAPRYQSSAAPDLDAAAPQLKARELRRMNQRALVLLAMVVALLLLVAYWMLSSAGQRNPRPAPRGEKVIVAQAPGQLLLPHLPSALPTHSPQAIPLAPPPPPTLPSLPQPGHSIATSPAAGHAPTPSQRRIAVRSDAVAAGAAASSTPIRATGPLPDNPPTGGLQARPTSAQELAHAGTLMQRGTYIRCVLETHIVSDIPSFTSCLVTERVYSFNGQRLLLPKGSKLLGSYERSPVGQRIAVVWDRILTPTGIDVDMASPGIDNLGGAGLPGHYDAHWRSRISSALFISLLSDAFKYEAAEHGPRSTTITNGVVTQEPFQSNTAQTVQNLANQAVRAAANRPPTITINQGTVVYVYVARDVDFSAVVARY